MNELLKSGREENNEDRLPLNLLNVKREQQNNLGKINSKLRAYISDRGSGYSKQALDQVKIIFYGRRIYIPKTMCRHVLDWYHLYLNYPNISRLDKKTREVCYWISLVTQTELHDKPFKMCQKFKNRKTLYGRLPPKNISELKLWDTVHVDLIVTYSKSIRQYQTGGAIIKNNVSLTCMSIIGPDTGWFEISKVLTYDLDEVTGGNDEYIDKSSDRARQLFNTIWLSRYPRPHKVVFDNRYEFKRDFTPLLNDFDIKLV